MGLTQFLLSVRTGHCEAPRRPSGHLHGRVDAPNKNNLVAGVCAIRGDCYTGIVKPLHFNLFPAIGRDQFHRRLHAPGLFAAARIASDYI
jgi:hypothetical protein